MAKVYKAVLYFTDHSDEVKDKSQLNHLIGNRLNSWVGVNIAEIKESQEFEWEDDLMINKRYAQVDDFEEYFKD